MKIRLYDWRRSLVVAITILALLMVTPIRSLGANPNPGVLPPHSNPFGHSYAEWSAKWWQWVFSIPSADNPLLDPSGENCDVGQSGHVWFLGGTFAVVEESPGMVVGEATRECTIPVGTAVFFPIINAECSTIEGNGDTEEELRACANDLVDHVTSLEVSIDGVALEDLNPANSPYRVESPLFSFTLPPGDLLGLGPGSSQAVSDGYWIMLRPFSVGQHTVHFSGVADFPEFGFTFLIDITYELNVVHK